MIDRLPQLKKFMIDNGQVNSDSGMNHAENYQEGQQNEGIDDQFFEEIKSVQEMIIALNKNNYKIQALKGKYAKAIKSTQEKSNSEEMNEIITQNSDLHTMIKQKIGALKDKVAAAEINEPNEPETKMKKNFFISLSKQVSDVLQKQQSYEDEFKTTVKDKIIRQVKLIERDIDDEKAQEYVDNPELAQEMLQRKIYGQASVTLKNTVSDIQDKFRDIKKLEASVNQCLQLFNELSALVYAQGERIDNIEANVADAKDYVEKGEVKLKKAKQHHKWGKKCMCIGIIIGLAILIIVIIVVVTIKK